MENLNFNETTSWSLRKEIQNFDEALTVAEFLKKQVLRYTQIPTQRENEEVCLDEVNKPYKRMVAIARRLMEILDDKGL